MAKKTKENITDMGEFDIELFVATDILGAKSLHYGYWEEKDEMTPENVMKAQERYTKKLIELIPNGVRTVLDVGSGIGDVSKAMVKAGYEVTSVSPDKNHAPFYEDTPEIDFHNTTIESFETDKKFDLVIYCESQNYFSAEVGVSKAKGFLNEGGHLLISGMFKLNDTISGKGVDIHKKSDYITIARDSGFNVVKEIDITKETTKTIVMSGIYLEKLKKAAGKVNEYYYKKLNPIKKFMIKLLAGKQIKIAQDLVEYYESRFDEKWYAENIEYIRLLFKLS